jgi:hypothetical protein
MNSKATKPDAKLIAGFVVAVLAVVGGLVATIFIPGDNAVSNDSESTTVAKENTKSEEEINYDATELKSRVEKVEELYTKFSDHLDAKYGKDATKYDFTDDPEAKAILEEFIIAIDEFDQTIAACPYDDLKESWQDFMDSFNKRREDIPNGVDETKDSDWAQKLFSIYFLAMSKAGL